jgi:hypothetical protein
MCYSHGILAEGCGKELCRRGLVMERARRGDGADTSRCPGPRSLPALLFCAILLAGCQPYFLPDRHVLFQPQTGHAVFMPAAEIACDPSDFLAQAKDDFAAGTKEEAEGREGCVDLYYRAAIDSWQHLESFPASSADSRYEAAWQI